MTISVKSVVSVILIVLNLVLFVQCQSNTNHLSNTTYPIEYTIVLNTPLDSTTTFDGTVVIQIGVYLDTDEIELNAKLIQYSEIKLFEIDGANEKPITIVNIRYPSEVLILESEKMLQIGKEYKIKIRYVGQYQNFRTGLYKLKLSNEGRKTMIASNLVPQYARLVFPCYDEPTFKAKFTLTIQHPVGYEAISNMNEFNTTTNSGMVQRIFHTTPVISVHTLAFAVLDYKSNCNDDDLKICVFYDEQHTADDVELVLQTTKNAIAELNSYLGVAINLSKLDIFPDDSNYQEYRSGSYGILNNNKLYFYFNSTKMGLVDKEIIVRHTIRQVSTLYFGNMLVAELWDDSWLIHGLAVLFEYIIADKLYPEFDEMNQFLSKLYESGFIDAAVKPTDSSTQSPSLLLDYLNVYKSAGILYMFKNIVGEIIFKKGLNTILSGDSSNLIRSDTFFIIFTHLAIENNVIPNHYDFNTILHRWLTQLRFPMVSATRSYIPSTEMRINQVDIINVYGLDYRTMEWWIPYTCTSQFGSSTARKWLENTSEDNIEHGFGEQFDVYSWMICNNEQSGFYYMNYDPNNYKLLANQLYNDHTKFSALTRAQLLHVGFITANAKYNSLGLLFQLGNYIHRENTYTPVDTFIKEFMKLSVQVYGTEPYENVTKYVADRIGPIYDRIRPNLLNIETNPLSYNDEKLRELIVYAACFSGYQNCLEDMNKLLKKGINDANFESLNYVYNELGSYIIHFGMVLADENLFWQIVALNSQNKEIANTIAFVHDSKLIDKLFTILATRNGTKINGTEIKLSSYERASILGQLSVYNLPALDKIFQFMKDKATILKELLDDQYHNVLSELSTSTKTNDRLVKLQELVELHKTPTQTFETELKEAEKNVKWCNDRIKEFQQILSEILEQVDDEDDGAVTLSVSIVMFFSLVFGSQLILLF